MSDDRAATTLLPQAQLFFQALGLACTRENNLFTLAQKLEGGLGLNQLLYEVPGDGREPEIDLSCFLSGDRGAARHLPSLNRLDIPSPWAQLLKHLAQQKDSLPDRWLNWRGLWLEFDSSVSSRTRPNLFVTLANNNNSNRQALSLLLDLIRDRVGIQPGIDQRIRQLHRDLPAGVSVVQIGFLLPRASGQRVKICLLGPTPHEVALLQQSMGLALSPELSAVWKKTMEAKPYWVCALDLYPDGTVTPAFEIQPTRHNQSSDRNWSRILSHLPPPQGALAQLDITRQRVQSCLVAHEWPSLLRKQWREDPTLVDSLLLTSLNHIKISSPHGNNLQVKYYFLQLPLFTTQQGTYERAGI